MPGRQFLHANSPSEIAKREQRGPDFVPEKPKGFRHWNHPEEIAKREAEALKLAARVPGQQTSRAAVLAAVEAKGSVVLPSPAAAGAGVVPVPLGEQLGSAPVVPVPSAVVPSAVVPSSVAPAAAAAGPTAMQRLRDLEQRFGELEDAFEELLTDLFGSEEGNAEERRKLLNVVLLDFPMVKESQLNLAARTRALAAAIGLEWHPDGALGPPLEPTPDPPLFPGLDAAASEEPPTRPDPLPIP